MDTNCRKRLHRWIKRFSLSDDINTDRHITDFCNEIQRREWLKVSFSILDICTEFIKVEEYNEFIYIGFSKVKHDRQMDSSFYHSIKKENRDFRRLFCCKKSFGDVAQKSFYLAI